MTALTGNIHIDALYDGGESFNDGYKVSTPVVVRYAFASATSFENSSSYVTFNDAQKQSVRQSLAAIEKVCGVRFIETSDLNEAAVCYAIDTNFVPHYGNFAGITCPNYWRPSWSTETIWYKPTYIYFKGETTANQIPIVTSTSISTEVALHETLHALGLKHPGDYGVSGTSGPFLPSSLDVRTNTVMSYNGNYTNKLQAFDIETLQYLYGKPADTNSVFVTPNTKVAMSDGVETESPYSDITELLLHNYTYSTGNGSRFGWAGSDKTFRMPGAPETFDGLSGNDTLVVRTNASAAQLSKNADGTYGLKVSFPLDAAAMGYSVTSGSPADYKWIFDANVTLKSFEKLVFNDKTIDLGVAEKAATLPAAQLKLLVEIYVAYFNRVPEASGFSYWIDQMKSGLSLEQIGNSFYSAAVQYSSLTGYSSTMSSSDFVKLIYKNVLGRTGANAPSDADVGYWAKNLDTGVDTRGTLVSTMLHSAHTFKGNASWGWVADLLDNKVAVGIYNAVTAGVDFANPADAVANNMAVASAVTSNDVSHAISLIGVNSLVPYGA